MNIEKLIQSYHQFLKDKTVVYENQNTGWHTISTPFLGMFNDTVELYCQLKDNKIFLSDDGRTLNSLELLGVNFNKSAKRKEIIDQIALNYGITIKESKEICVEATEKTFAQKKHNLITAILEISDLYYLAKTSNSSVFREKVQIYLDELDMIYTPQFIAKGSTGLEFTFDFQIASKKSEIVIKAFNTLNQLHLSNFLFGWDDIRETRQKVTGKRLHGLAIINDIERDTKLEHLDAIASKNADFILWSEKSNASSRAKLFA